VFTAIGIAEIIEGPANLAAAPIVVDRRLDTIEAQRRTPGPPTTGPAQCTTSSTGLTHPLGLGPVNPRATLVRINQVRTPPKRAGRFSLTFGCCWGCARWAGGKAAS